MAFIQMLQQYHGGGISPYQVLVLALPSLYQMISQIYSYLGCIITKTAAFGRKPNWWRGSTNIDQTYLAYWRIWSTAIGESATQFANRLAWLACKKV